MVFMCFSHWCQLSVTVEKWDQVDLEAMALECRDFVRHSCVIPCTWAVHVQCVIHKSSAVEPFWSWIATPFSIIQRVVPKSNWNFSVPEILLSLAPQRTFSVRPLTVIIHLIYLVIDSLIDVIQGFPAWDVGTPWSCQTQIQGVSDSFPGSTTKIRNLLQIPILISYYGGCQWSTRIDGGVLDQKKVWNPWCDVLYVSMCCITSAN